MACGRTRRLTIEERVELIKLFFANQEDLTMTMKAFNNQHEMRNPISRNSVKNLIDKFKSTGSVQDKKRTGRHKTQTDESHAYEVLQHVRRSPHKSTRKISQECNMSQSSVLRILHENSFRPFKVVPLQELYLSDPVRRLQFCSWFLEHCDVWQTVFTDEAIFHVKGLVSNSFSWAMENPRNFIGSRSLHSPKVLVWAGVFHGQIIGPYFFNGNVTGKNQFAYFTIQGTSYLAMLQENVIPAIREIAMEVRNPIWFQHDGAPPHNASIVRNYLDEEFPGRWIGRGGPKEWPPRSPDLSPLDFYLWGYLKCKVYTTKPQTVEQLRESIVQQCQTIPKTTLLKVEENCVRRMLLCKQNDGKHFEQLL